jgi:hypothetical protein
MGFIEDSDNDGSSTKAQYGSAVYKPKSKHTAQKNQELDPRLAAVEITTMMKNNWTHPDNPHANTMDSITAEVELSLAAANRLGMKSLKTTCTLSPERTMCPKCRESFRNREQLEEHKKAFTYECQRCFKQKWPNCGSKGTLKGRETYCRNSVGGCEKHRLCFLNPYDMFEHASSASHRYCYYDGCDSDLSKMYKHDSKAVQKHINKKHA